MGNNLVYLGKLGRAVGLKGELRIILETDFLAQFKKDLFLYLQDCTALKIQNIDLSKNTVKFDGIDTQEVASKYTNKELFSTFEDTRKNCKLQAGQFFWFDLIGLEVYEDGSLLGRVDDISRFTGSDYFEVVTDMKLVSQGLPKTFLIPYIPNFVMNIEIDKKIIYVQNSLDILKNS